MTVTDIDNGSSNNYILDTAQTETTLDISGYSTGVYSISLIRDGELIDSKNLIKS